MPNSRPERWAAGAGLMTVLLSLSYLFLSPSLLLIRGAKLVVRRSLDHVLI